MLVVAAGMWELVAPEHVNRVGIDTVKKFAATGAQILATACPQCVRVFERAVKESKINLTVLDVAGGPLNKAISEKTSSTDHRSLITVFTDQCSPITVFTGSLFTDNCVY
ncbi:MAG: hypothetical protein U0401_18060 [Anaerolineae bacterium]